MFELHLSLSDCVPFNLSLCCMSSVCGVILTVDKQPVVTAICVLYANGLSYNCSLSSMCLNDCSYLCSRFSYQATGYSPRHGIDADMHKLIIMILLWSHQKYLSNHFILGELKLKTNAKQKNCSFDDSVRYTCKASYIL